MAIYTLEEKLKEVAELRASLELAKKAVVDIENDPKYLEAIQARSAASFAVNQAEKDAQEMALLQYENDKSTKKLVGGKVTVKEIVKSVFTYDPEIIKTWAIKEATGLLALDVKKFEKHAKAVADTIPVPGVKIDESKSLRAEIASDLSELLAGIGDREVSHE